jgi:hypothetical protein
VSRLVGCRDLQLKELHVPEPVRLALHRFDLIVRPLHRAAREHDVIIREQSRTVCCQRFGYLLEHLDPGLARAPNPAVAKRSRERLPGLVPEPSQIVLQVVGRRQWLVQGQRFLQPLFFVLLRIEILRVL